MVQAVPSCHKAMRRVGFVARVASHRVRMKLINLFEPLPPGERGDERFVPLWDGGGFRLEQIVSHGRAGAPGVWYDQPEDEWVALLRGSATLVFEPEETLQLRDGDALLIPAHRRHRVAATSEDAVWLALHARPRGASESRV